MLIGLVGKPNVGKSTFFKAATLAEVLIANYPFATIKANRGVGYVKIKDLAVEFGKHSNPREGFVKGDWRFVPVEVVDVAGLVPGASEGKGLGNQFLNDLTSADAFIHVVDVSGETDVEGKQTKDYYPGEDILFLERELDLWYADILKKIWKSFSKRVVAGNEDFAEAVARQFSGLKVDRDDVKSIVLKQGYNVSKASEWSDEEVFGFARELRRVSKPMIIAANKIDRPKSKDNLERIKKEFDYPIIPCSAESELALREASKDGLIDYTPGENDFEIIGELNEKQKKALDFIKENVLVEGTGVQNVLNKVVFELLGYVAVYPAGAKLVDSDGNVLPDCFLMPSGSTAIDFAYRLHTDIGNGFVKAIDVKTKRAVGKEYVLKSGDGLEILTR